MTSENIEPLKFLNCPRIEGFSPQVKDVVPLKLTGLASGPSSVNFFSHMTRQQVLDLYFLEARAKLIDIAAFLDRFRRAEGEGDFRMTAFRQALRELDENEPDAAKRVLLSLSDPTQEPIAAATTKAACGAWPETR